MTQARSNDKKLEGEGSYSATRGYNSKLRRHVREQNVQKLADDAGKALEGPERAELDAADKAARKGPRAASSKKP